MKKEHTYDSLNYQLIAVIVCFAFWFLILPFCIGVVLLLNYTKNLKEYKEERAEKIEAMQRALEQERMRIERFKADTTDHIDSLRRQVTNDAFLELQANIQDAEKKLERQNEKIKKSAYAFKAIQAYINAFADKDILASESKKIVEYVQSIEVFDYLSPTSEIKLHSTDLKDLKKQYREINKNIDSVLAAYEKRYNTKANVSIYRLMVLGLRSELQNVLYTMKFGKLDDAERDIEDIAEKYIKIASDGNQSIAPTVVKFVSQAKSLFIDAVRVEYEYYVRSERIKEEQRALREQMRQEAEERRRLEAEQKKIEAEESKYETEMEKIRSQIFEADSEKASVLQKRIEELEALMAKVREKKETIAKLQNGKAGCVYVISNLGSFGDHVFKVGMTRRFVPQERIDELGDASVPFSFDVHSFIFSEDASALETEMHRRLNEKRVNKVNLRKEFFDVSLDEIEALVYEIQPAAEFNRTMAAEQYRQSLSMSTVLEMREEENLEDTE